MLRHMTRPERVRVPPSRVNALGRSARADAVARQRRPCVRGFFRGGTPSGVFPIPMGCVSRGRPPAGMLVLAVVSAAGGAGDEIESLAAAMRGGSCSARA